MVHTGSRKRIGAALAAVVAVLPFCVWLWGFTVDDALISARVAAHIAAGQGARFNTGGPVVDAVTPLGYAELLSLFRYVLGRGDALTLFHVAKVLGLAAWLVAVWVLAGQIVGTGLRARRFVPLLIVALSAPLSGWAVSGMETGLVTLLATLGLLGGAGGALALGAAAAWRPELAPFAVALLIGQTWSTRVSARAGAQRLVLFALLPLALALARQAWFGSVVPLSFYAKPSDFGHGLRYAAGAFAFTGLPWLVLPTPREAKQISRSAWPLFAALAAHWAALVLCGGDWMALYRLVVPVLPCAALLGAYVAEQARFAPYAVRGTLALTASLVLAFGLGAPARRVGDERAALIAQARQALARDARIAALDVGWVGAASEATVIDLAGVTDPRVAFFPGGHTSKRIPKAWLSSQHPTAIVLLLAAGTELEPEFADSRFARVVERRVAQLVASEFRVRTTLTLGTQRYIVLEPVDRPCP